MRTQSGLFTALIIIFFVGFHYSPTANCNEMPKANPGHQNQQIEKIISYATSKTSDDRSRAIAEIDALLLQFSLRAKAVQSTAIDDTRSITLATKKKNEIAESSLPPPSDRQRATIKSTHLPTKLPASGAPQNECDSGIIGSLENLKAVLSAKADSVTRNKRVAELLSAAKCHSQSQAKKTNH